jgi:hypothetical protein
MDTTTTTTHDFSERELARLTVYRSAIAAGFYSDQVDFQTDESTVMEAPVLDLGEVSANDVVGAEPGTIYPFTRAERARLAACRKAVLAGYYSDAA